MIGVRDALAMRQMLAEWLDEPWYRRDVLATYMALTTSLASDIDGKPVTVSERSIITLAEKFQSSLRVGEVYTLSDDMMTFAEQAGDELPDDYRAEPWMLHAQHGFLALPRPLVNGRGEDAIRMLTWHHGMGSTNRDAEGRPTGEWRVVPGVEVNLWGYWRFGGEELARRAIAPVGSDFQPYGMPTIGYSDDPPDTPPRLSPASRLIFALQMLMRQELPSLTRHRIPKADQRIMRRLNLPGSDVTVIELRRRAPSQETGTSGRHLTRRHYVRGTWAPYWIGPSHPHHPGGTEEKVRTYLYRVPYIKGPADAPLAPTRARVHKITR